MTVTYTNQVATTTGVGIFWKLLGRWRGSIYKLIWREVIAYCCLYYSLKILYEFGLRTDQQRTFIEVVKYCRLYSTSIPLSFVLGFYVNLVMFRWWDQYKSLPWPDTLGIQVSSLVDGLDERSRMMRRTVMRYMNLSYVMALTIVSPRVSIRFPSLANLVDEGFLEPNEREIFSNLNKDVPHSLYWLPLVWASSILTRARNEGIIKDKLSLKSMLDTIANYRSGLASLLGYHTISIPLVYTQVVTLAVYSFFAVSLISSQYVPIELNATDLVVPWFTLLQYLFYVGWLKVAETLANPFGLDDDDFELNVLIDRNFQVGYMIVDTMHDQYPELIQDKYWEDIMPRTFTPSPEPYQRNPFTYDAKLSPSVNRANTNGPSRKNTKFSNVVNRVMAGAWERTTIMENDDAHPGIDGSNQKLFELQKEEFSANTSQKISIPTILTEQV